MECKPLENRTIVITRAAEQADEFAAILSNLGAVPVALPVIKIVPLDTPELQNSLREANRYSWIIFTSCNGAGIFLEKLKHTMSPGDLRPRICAIGPGTSRRIEELGFKVDMVPRIFQAEGVIEEFSGRLSGPANKESVLIPRASRARELLPESLMRMGVKVNVVPVYRTVFPSGRIAELRRVLEESTPDMITFTSSSTVANFVKLAGRAFDLGRYKYASIGPITSETALKAGLNISATAEESTLESLAEAIADYFSGDQTGGSRSKKKKARVTGSWL